MPGTQFSLSFNRAIRPIVPKTFPPAEAAEALRYLVEDVPFGSVVLTLCQILKGIHNELENSSFEISGLDWQP